MVKRVVVIAAVGIATLFALPTLALGQEEEGSTETSSTKSESVTKVEGTETEVSAVLEEDVEEESTEETKTTTSDEVEPQTAATTSSSTTTTASTAANSTASTQTSLTTAKKSSGKRKKGRKSRKSCSASSRGGGQLARASAPPASGCYRLNSNEGQLPLPDGTVLNITETSQGVIEFTVSGGPTGTFSGTIFVKGGPSSPGFACVFNGVTAGTCHAPENNGKFFGVSHVDACPGAFIPPEEDTPEGGRSEGKEKQKKVASKEKQKEPTFVASESVTPQGETLPFTGLPVAWLLIVGAGLISGGLAIRRKP